MRNRHDVDVRWHYCDQPACQFRCKSGSGVTRHKAHVHGIGTRWYACPHPNCVYVTKQRGHLPVHVRRHHPAAALESIAIWLRTKKSAITCANWYMHTI